jgi:hypothetical protein
LGYGVPIVKLSDIGVEPQESKRWQRIAWSKSSGGLGLSLIFDFASFTASSWWALGLLRDKWAIM